MIIREFEPHRNFEQLRYRLSEDINSLYMRYERASEHNGNTVVNSILATIFSGFITEGAFSSAFTNKYRIVKDGSSVSLVSENQFNLLKLLCMLVIFSVVFLFFYFIVACIRCRWKKFKRKHFPDKGIGESERRNTVVKNFDNFACDGIVEAYGYTDIFYGYLDRLKKHVGCDGCSKDDFIKMLSEQKIVDEEAEKLLEQMKFAFYEVIYNMQIVVDKTNTLLEYGSSHIRTANKFNEGNVDDFRVINMSKLVRHLEKFLTENRPYMAIREYRMASLDSRMEQLERLICDMNNYVQRLQE